MSSDVVISVRNLGKSFPVYAKPTDRLRQFMMPRLHRLLQVEPRRYYDEYWALRDVSFEVHAGEQLGIVGRNGAGKSTLLQIICGTLTPTLGEVQISGRVAALLELGAGFNPELTGAENIFLNGSVLGLSQQELEECYDSIVAFADIPGFIDQPVKNYSSGMFMRLAFSVAVHVEPDVLVVDEALAVGDEAFQRKCLVRMEAMRSRGTTVLFVSHSAQTVIQLCDRAIWIDRGGLVMDATPKTVTDAYHKSMGDNTRPAERTALCEGEPLSLSAAVIEYPACGGRIVSARLIDEAGLVSRRLEHERRYRFLYQLRLDERMSGLRCGMLIKTTTGIEVAGAVVTPHASGDIAVTDAGDVEVEFAFTCLLSPGRYFINCGATAQMDGEERYVHRLVDAFEVEVIHPSLRNRGGVSPQGLVDLKFSGRALGALVAAPMG